MRQFLALAAVVTLVFAMFVSPLSAAKPEKVLVAHLAEVVEVTPDNAEGTPAGTYYYYNVIEISAKAVEAHLAHGDVLEGGSFPDGTTAQDLAKGQKIEAFVAAQPE